MAFTSAVLMTALAISMPAIATYAGLKRERQGRMLRACLSGVPEDPKSRD